MASIMRISSFWNFRIIFHFVTTLPNTNRIMTIRVKQANALIKVPRYSASVCGIFGKLDNISSTTGLGQEKIVKKRVVRVSRYCLETVPPDSEDPDIESQMMSKNLKDITASKAKESHR